MTDTTPRLPATSDDAVPYAPYSALAVAAIAVAAFFALLLLTLGLSAWMAGQPLFDPELLLLAVVALVLAFAARRQITNSEGTRVGLPLCNAAWWIAVVGGCGFLAYLVGIGFAIRSDAESAFNRWKAIAVKINPVDPKNIELGSAFHGTLSPDKQATFSPNDTNKLLTIYGNPFLAFRQCDLVRLVTRNPNEVEFDVVGLEDWKNEKNSLNCRLTIRVRCPEGEYTSSISMQKQTVKGKDQPVWQVMPPQNEQTNFFKGGRLNAYGERIRDLEISAQQLVYWHFLPAIATRAHQARVPQEFAAALPDPKLLLDRLYTEAINRLALGGGLALSAPEPTDAFADLARKYFVPLGEEKPDELRKQFARYWRGGEFRAPGQIIQKNADMGAIIIPGDAAWQIRVPIEIQESPLAGQTAARGTVVCVLDDPATLAELAALKKAGGDLHVPTHRPNADKPVPWRIVRIESDLKLVLPARAAPGGE